MPENILVTGGAGYIGSHTCKALHRAGFTPVVFDNLSLGHREFVRWGPLVVGDTRDGSQVATAIADHRIKAVVHFAALSSVGESMDAPEKYYENNVGGLLGLLDGMRQSGCETIVFSSTAAVYGEAKVSPITEVAIKNPVNPYGRSKLICEQILDDCRKANGLKAVTLRYFNASGADPEAEIGELRDQETHLIPRAMMALQGYIHDFEVFGSDFPTADGTAIRDYIHVCDLADAHVLALRHLLAGGHGGAFNLGISKGYSVAEVLAEIARTTGRDMEAPKGPRRPGDPVQLIADASHAREALGFAPELSSLETIVRTAWSWHQSAHPLRNA